MILLEWDEAKAENNWRKHGIGFELASEVFDDPYAVAEQDRIEGDEERWRTIGIVDGLIVVFVGHTVREQGQDEIIRIITARKATRKEREYYDKNRKKNAG